MRNLARLIGRSLWLGAELSLLALRFLFLYVRRGGRWTMQDRAIGLQAGSRRILRVVASRVELNGPLPRSGLLVSNHLSYVDILLLGSLAPAVFVSKAEVKGWPIFGWFAALGGTVFVQRERRGHVGEVSGRIRSLLAEKHLVILFPEGTSSDGREILRFKSALLEPAVGQKCPLSVAWVSYGLSGGSVETDVCYWGDMTFAPHFFKLLAKPRVTARASFAEIQSPAADRKELAKQLHAAAVQLKDSSARSSGAVTA